MKRSRAATVNPCPNNAQGRIVHQGIDGDHACPSRHPPFAFRISPEEEVGQGHREDLGAEAVNGPERL